MSGVDYNFNSWDYSVSGSKDHSCSMKVDANVNKYTSCTIKSVNKIHMRVLLENQCHPTLLMNGWKAEKRKLMLVKFDILL